MITIEHVHYQIHDVVRKNEKVYNIVANKDKINGKFINTIYVNVTVKHNRRSISLNKQIWISKMSKLCFLKDMNPSFPPNMFLLRHSASRQWKKHEAITKVKIAWVFIFNSSMCFRRVTIFSIYRSCVPEVHDILEIFYFSYIHSGYLTYIVDILHT